MSGHKDDLRRCRHELECRRAELRECERALRRKVRCDDRFDECREELCKVEAELERCKHEMKSECCDVHHHHHHGHHHRRHSSCGDSCMRHEPECGEHKEHKVCKPHHKHHHHHDCGCHECCERRKRCCPTRHGRVIVQPTVTVSIPSTQVMRTALPTAAATTASALGGQNFAQARAVATTATPLSGPFAEASAGLPTTQGMGFNPSGPSI